MCCDRADGGRALRVRDASLAQLRIEVRNVERELESSGLGFFAGNGEEFLLVFERVLVELALRARLLRDIARELAGARDLLDRDLVIELLEIFFLVDLRDRIIRVDGTRRDGRALGLEERELLIRLGVDRRGAPGEILGERKRALVIGFFVGVFDERGVRLVELELVIEPRLEECELRFGELRRVRAGIAAGAAAGRRLGFRFLERFRQARIRLGVALLVRLLHGVPFGAGLFRQAFDLGEIAAHERRGFGAERAEKDLRLDDEAGDVVAGVLEVIDDGAKHIADFLAQGLESRDARARGRFEELVGRRLQAGHEPDEELRRDALDAVA